MSNGKVRLRALRASMDGDGVDALLVTHLPDVRWLCGFTGIECGTGGNGEEGRSVHGWPLHRSGKGRDARGSRGDCGEVRVEGSLRVARVKADAKRASYDPEHTTVAELALMRSAISPKVRRSFFASLERPLISELRMEKDADELRLMEKAAALGDRVFNAVLPILRSGIKESEIAASLEFFARSMGEQRVCRLRRLSRQASGRRCRMGGPAERKTPRNGFITLDFRVILKGYCSDMTRTVCVGKLSRQERAAYEAVLEAQEAGVGAAGEPGATCGEVDEAARAVLAQGRLIQVFYAFDRAWSGPRDCMRLAATGGRAAVGTEARDGSDG